MPSACAARRSPGHSVGLPDGAELTVSVEALGREVQRRRGDRLLVTVLAPGLAPGALAGVFGRIASCGGNVERIVQLVAYPVTSYELVVGDADAARCAVS